MRHHRFGVGVVIGDELGERGVERVRRLQILVQPGFEFIEQNLELCGAKCFVRPHLDRVDQFRTCVAQHFQPALLLGFHPGTFAGAVVIADNAEPPSREIARIGCVVHGLVHQHTKQGCSARHRARHGACRVLTGRNGNDALLTDQTKGRFDADHAVQCGRTDDRSIGLRSDGQRRKPRGDGHRRTAGRAAGVAVQHIGVVGLAA